MYKVLLFKFRFHLCKGLCLLQFDNKKWGSLSSFLSHNRLKLNLGVFLAGHIVAMETYCPTKLTANMFTTNDWVVFWYHDSGNCFKPP